MPETFSNSAAAIFLDRDRVIEELRRAAADLKSARPEVQAVYLFGSWARGNWTADSDADLIVVADRAFPDWFERSRYHIYLESMPTDTLVYTPSEFARVRAALEPIMDL